MGGARIEISIDEYNSYHQRIKELEETIVKQDKVIGDKNNDIESLIEGLKYIVHDVNLFDRIFNWKDISETVSLTLEKNEHS